MIRRSEALRPLSATLLGLALAAGMAEEATSQAVTFDIASFTPPPGWQTNESNGILVFHDAGARSGRASFGQIMLFPSQPIRGRPLDDFLAAWKRRVEGPLGIRERPEIEARETVDGRTVVTGFVTVTRAGDVGTTLLMTSSGAERIMGVLVNLVGDGHRAEVEAFFASLAFDGQVGGTVAAVAEPPVAREPASRPPAGKLDYVYQVPPGWEGTQYPDGIVFRSPMFDNGERCLLTILPIRPAQGPLDAETLRLFRETHAADPLEGGSSPLLPITLIRGVSPFGWPYLVLRKSIGGQAGDYGTLVSRTMLVVQLGDQLAPIAATSKDPLVSRCFGQIAGNVWPGFLASLRFTGWTPPGGDDWAQRLAGTWTAATGSVADRYTFAPNGRYASAAAALHRRRVSTTEVLQTTQAFFGDGAYAIEGNLLTLRPDGGDPTARWIRVEQESQDGGRTWRDRLCLLAPGGGEVCYDRER